MTTCCVYAMCTSALVNGCEWFIQHGIYLFVLKVCRGEKACEKMFVLFVCELVRRVEGCGCMSNSE